jgi:hypothetical protein
MTVTGKHNYHGTAFNVTSVSFYSSTPHYVGNSDHYCLDRAKQRLEELKQSNAVVLVNLSPRAKKLGFIEKEDGIYTKDGLKVSSRRMYVNDS